MNIYFLNPPWWVREESGRIRHGIRAGSRWPFTVPSAYKPDEFIMGTYMPYPMFLGSAAAWVARAMPEHKVVLRDSIARGESYTTFSSWLKANPPDVVIIETGAASWDHERNTLLSIKKKWPACRIGVAGPPVQSLSKTDVGGVVDAWILGEYEKGSVQFIGGQSGVIPFSLLTHGELATAPYPMFDEEVAHHYADANPKGAVMPELQLWTSRSCTFKCVWCSWPATMTNDDPDGTQSRAFRHYTPEWLESFIRHRIAVADGSGRPLASIRLDDDTMNGGNKHTLNVCAVMKRIGLPWSAMCRADMVTREAWQAMKDAGCFGVKLGFESGSQRVVDEIIHKHLNLEKAAETARWLRSIGLTVHGTFTVGMPHETAAEREETRRFIRMLYETGAIDTHQLSGTAEIPGTPMANAVHDDPAYTSNPDGQLRAEQLAAK